MNDYVTKGEFDEFRKEMKADLAAFKEEMRIMLFEALQAQTEMLKAYVDEKIEELKKEIRRDRHYMDLFIRDADIREKENRIEHSGFSRRLKALEA